MTSDRSRPRAVLFDLDGTLLDTLDDIADAMNQVLVRVGAPAREREAYRSVVGDGVESLVRRSLPPGMAADDALVRRGVTEMRQIYGAIWDHKTRPYPGVPELLAALERRPLPRAVLSNKRDDLVVQMVERLLPGFSFAVVRGERDGVPRKPDPTAALAIADGLGIPPAAWLFVGDSDIDMRTARAAGMVAVGASWGFRGVEELVRSGAEHLLETPADLLALL